jgi:GT2 family glycosyltransferase
MEASLSVIIPAYSPRNEFPELLSALTQQCSRDPFEIIVVDDGSPNTGRNHIRKSVEKADQESSDVTVSLVRLDENSGAARARNEGVKLAAGQFFLFIDSDCFICSTNYIQTAYELSRSKPNSIIGGTIDGSGRGYIAFSDHFCHWVTNPPGHTGPAPEPHLVSNNMLVSRQLWNQVGPFSEALRSGEDTDFCFRATHQGISLWLSDSMRIGHFDRTSLSDFFKNYLFCGSYRPYFYGNYHKWKRFLTNSPRWIRILLIPVTTAGSTVRCLYRWSRYDTRVFLAIFGILLGSFAQALGCALGPPRKEPDQPLHATNTALGPQESQPD